MGLLKPIILSVGKKKKEKEMQHCILADFRISVGFLGPLEDYGSAWRTQVNPRIPTEPTAVEHPPLYICKCFGAEPQNNWKTFKLFFSFRVLSFQ